MDFTSGNTDMHLLVIDLKKVEGCGSEPVVWPFSSCSSTSPSHRVDQAIECCPSPLQWLMLMDIGRNWHMLSLKSIPNMLIGWHVWWICRPWRNWDIFSFQKLCADPCDMGLCIILKCVDGGGWMAWQWTSGAHHGLSVHWNGHRQNAVVFIVSSLSAHTITPPWGTLFITLTPPKCSPTRAIHAVCHVPSTYETRIHLWRAHFASGHRRWAFAHWRRHWTAVRSSPWWGRQACRCASLRQFDRLCRIYLVVQTQFHQLSGWLVSDNPAGEEAGCEGAGLDWLHVVYGWEAGWTYWQIL